jgi:hypothetical protein
VTHSLAAVAEAALANLEDLPAGMSGLARSNRPASPTERRDAIAQAWRDEPGITDTALAERSGSAAEPSNATPRLSRSGASSAGRRTAGAEANGPGRSTPPSTGDFWPGWPTSSAGRPPRKISAETSWPAGSPSGPGSVATAAGDYRRRRCGSNAAPCVNLSATPAAPSWPPTCTPPGGRHPRRRPSLPNSMSGCWAYPTLRPRPGCATRSLCDCWVTSACVPARCAACNSAISSGLG